MTLAYQSGDRIQGLAADSKPTNVPSGSRFEELDTGLIYMWNGLAWTLLNDTPISAGWKELGRTTLGSSGDTIDVSSLPDKRYYMTLINHLPTGGGAECGIRCNGDTGTNYSSRKNKNGTEGTITSSANGMGEDDFGELLQLFRVDFISNYASNEKMNIFDEVGGDIAGEANGPDHLEGAGKWANTSAAINQLTAFNSGGGSYNTGSEMVVLGWDPADVHTDNFWEQLASVDLSGGAADTMSASIADKKYLWIQWFQEATGTINSKMQVGDTSLDTATNYAYKHSSDGAAWAAVTDTDDLQCSSTSSATNRYGNMFVVNVAGREKLFVSRTIDANTAGAANAPARHVMSGKWDETSNQIGIVGIINAGAGSMDVKSQMTIWGAD